MIGLDTNLLIYAHRQAVPEHESARAAIEQAAASGRGWGVAIAAVAEFWSVVTHPAASGRPSTAKEAREFVDALAAAGCRLWRPGARFGERLIEVAEDLAIQGPRIFDLQIALTAYDNSAEEIWTHDRDFRACPGLAVHDPIG